MISIEANFDMKAIHASMEKRAEEKMTKVVAFFREKGIEFTTKARLKTYPSKNGPYNNITYNLVSSVGFSIARSRQIVETYFPLEGTGAEGKAKGEAKAELEALNACGPDDIVIALVAGEDYASYVQGNERDVVKGSSNAFIAYVNQIWGAYK